MLVMCCEDTGMNNSSPQDLDPLVHRLSAYNTCCSNLVSYLGSLIEHERHDILVISNSDDRLDHKFPASRYSCSAGAIISVLPTNAGILLVNADNILHWHNVTRVSRKDRAQVMDCSKTIAAELQVVSHRTCTSVTQVEGCFPMEWRSRVGIWNIHI